MIYLDDNMIVASKLTERPLKGRTLSGYGKNLPTRGMIQLNNKRWYRVKAICYSNTASLYIRTKHAGDRYLDYACEERINQVSA